MCQIAHHHINCIIWWANLHCNNKHPQASVASMTGLFLAHFYLGSAENFAVSPHSSDIGRAHRNHTLCLLLQLPLSCDHVPSAPFHWPKQVTGPYLTSRAMWKTYHMPGLRNTWRIALTNTGISLQFTKHLTQWLPNVIITIFKTAIN